MSKYKSKVIVDKYFLKKQLTRGEDNISAIKRLVDNSIQAYESLERKNDICEVLVDIFDDLIVVKDNSGGINENISEVELFRIGGKSNDKLSGVGLKKALFKLGNTINIESNKKDNSKRFILNFKDEINHELGWESENMSYNPNSKIDTKVCISNLEDDVKKEILSKKLESELLINFSKIYRKKIDKKLVKIKINGTEVKSSDINGKKLIEKNFGENYSIALYKKNEGEKSGVDFFINDYLIDNRAKWANLTESKHSYKNCIVEINAFGNKEDILLKKDEIKNQMIKFIKENQKYFIAKERIIQFEEPSDDVEAMKEYYEVNTAKALGKKAFNRLYQEFKNDEKKKFYKY
ncbi:ATP-binding protein [Clostridium mediterraneense]|uniref:ATP-binding protein n=1 Tax=Clostridium mediterraneense TaxID=1805472 RepID=UPI0008314DC6|nr:ATP-binding protein [Clostridium mediterraneense]